MFEKEAEKRARKLEESQTLGVYDNDEDYARDSGWNEGEVAGYEEGFKDGAEFGYNKAKGELEEKYKETICNLEMNLNSVTERLEELNKANEWYYVKDGKYPAHSNRVLVLTDEGVGFGIYGLDNQKWYTYDTGFDVIAWKEIELPKEIKEK